MADDPIVASAVTVRNIGQNIRLVSGLLTGSADYDDSGGMVLDLSDYGTYVLYGTMNFNPYDETAAVVEPSYVSAVQDAATGYVHVSWVPAIGDAGEAAQAMEEIADTTDLHTYKWHFSCMMYGPTV